MTKRSAKKPKPAPKQPVRKQSPEEIADAFDVHHNTVRKWPAAGCPHSRVKGKLLFSLDEVNKWVRETKRKTTPGRPPKPKPEGPPPGDSSTDKDYWLARKYKNQCLREEGELVNVSEALRWFADVLSKYAASLNNTPAAVIPRLQGLTPGEQEAVLRDHLDEARHAAANEVPPFSGGPAFAAEAVAAE